MATGNLTIEAALASARERYAKDRPKSLAAFESSQRVLPGGNTRSVLHFDPFPVTMERGEGAEVWDIDGHHYVDFVGEFSAGLYGHSDPLIKSAVVRALEGGTVLAAPTAIDVQFASAIAERFPSIQTLRFCNSGTEANILAIVTAIAFTGRRKVLVFQEAYHGGVLVFSGTGSPINLPFDFVVAPYNDIDATKALIRQHAVDLAAVIVEPILGAAGNIPGSAEFLSTLREETERCEALLIFDEVKTSRCGAHGIQGLYDISPDLTTLGKYIGGGLPTGVFGGRRDIMERYNPASGNALRHAGTFNNNVCSLAAGYTGLTKVFTVDRAEEFLNTNEAFRRQLSKKMADLGVPVQFVGLGSMFTVHFSNHSINAPGDIPPSSRSLAQLLHMECLLDGVLLASRGDVFVSLPINESQRAALADAVSRFADTYGDLIRREIPEPD
jgi:glutamate-1-semialdehyde 2,1-aminomutase